MHFKELQNWFYISDLKATSILYIQSVGRKEFSNEVEGKPATKPAGLLNLKQSQLLNPLIQSETVRGKRKMSLRLLALTADSSNISSV